MEPGLFDGKKNIEHNGGDLVETTMIFATRNDFSFWAIPFDGVHNGMMLDMQRVVGALSAHARWRHHLRMRGAEQ